MRVWAVLLFCLLAGAGAAQFPLVRSLGIKPGQQRPGIDALAHDSLGLLWAGSDLGLFRTDGEWTEVVWRSEGVSVLALERAGASILAAMDNGLILRCTQLSCDTMFLDTALVDSPVRDLVVLPSGAVGVATYGAGLWILRDGHMERWGVAQGLPDDHVNALETLPDDRVVLATDQGLAVIGATVVEQVFDTRNGLPDNLILALDVAADGSVFAGTDAHGVFRLHPNSGKVHVLDSTWAEGSVSAVHVQADQVWVGTQRNGVTIYTGKSLQRCYTAAPVLAAGPVRDLQVGQDGAIWWCNGTDQVHLADPDLLLIPDHEGVDMRRITALCTDPEDRIWFATDQGLFVHANAFTQNELLVKIPLVVDARTPIVSLAASADGRIWAATFGNGVHAVDTNGHVIHYGAADGLGNDNVLSVRSQGERVWCATLDGVARWDGHRFQHLAGTEGFSFDVLPIADDSVYIATDGLGILRWENGTASSIPSTGRTFYSLTTDNSGTPWAMGPGTGLCRIGDGVLRCTIGRQGFFDQDLYALGEAGGRLLVFGSNGVAALDPHTGLWSDLTARLGSEGAKAQLNVLARTRDGAIWLGSDQGLLRIRTDVKTFEASFPLHLLGVTINGERIPPTDRITTTHDRNDLVLQFTALHYADPGALRFEYRMGVQGKVLRTRDRELAFMDLAPGIHRVQLRAVVGEEGSQGEWRTITVEVRAPWWRRPWILIALLGLALGLVVFFVRIREGRLRERQRLEEEKVKFQLDALRSQVDPHFLFNSFNTLLELIETDQGRAAEHVEKLSEFFRQILLVRDKELIPLRDEVGTLHTYFGLEQQRFGRAIDLLVDVPKECETACVVPLTLQLLVENALKHNVATVADPLRVEVRAVGELLVVENPNRPRRSAVRSTGFGLESITKRYAALSAMPVRVERTDRCFRVTLPLIQCHERTDR